LLVLEKQVKEAYGGKLLISIENKEAFLNIKADNEVALKMYEKDIDDLQEKRAKLSIDIKTALELSLDKPVKPSEVLEMLDLTERRLRGFTEAFRKMKQIINIQDSTDVGEIRSRLSLLEKNIQTLKSAFQDEALLKNAELQKKQAEEYIKTNQANFNRIEKGFLLLSEWASNSGTDQLDAFFAQNLAEVTDIFRTIHSPREFKSIATEKGQLHLIKNNGETRKISEISTGQRAALAISVFISLNRKLKNGPNIMMFDDPVSHIDDLNALSFLDFLRFFMLKEDRQIFFATANTRLASLIEKKFTFLEGDFKQWDLKRELTE
jgi:exonuclease SbcC